MTTTVSDKCYLHFCEWCFQHFIRERDAVRFCSKRCRGAFMNHKDVFGDAYSTPVPYCACGLPVTHDVGASRGKRPRGMFCSMCRVAYERDVDRQRGSHKTARRREAYRRGERFTVADLRARDGDVCYLCGEQMLFDKSGRLGGRASIDHVVPLIRGGLHTLENCKLAHHRCNAGKGAK